MTVRAKPEGGDTRDAASDDLRQIVLKGAELLDEADQVVAECKQLDDHGADLAHRGHHLASGDFALRNRIAQLPPTDLSRQVEQWLNFEQQIVEQALILGYRPDSPTRHELPTTSAIRTERRPPTRVNSPPATVTRLDALPAAIGSSWI